VVPRARRAGGGVLADLGAHLIMIALGLVPERRRFVAHACARSDAPGWRPTSTTTASSPTATAPVLDAFAAHIRARRQPDLGIVVDTMRLIGALLVSARRGRPVAGRFRGGAWS